MRPLHSSNQALLNPIYTPALRPAVKRTEYFQDAVSHGAQNGQRRVSILSEIVTPQPSGREGK
jgi:hypothetical protein